MRCYLLLFSIFIWSCNHSTKLKPVLKDSYKDNKVKVKQEKFIYDQIFNWKKLPLIKALIGQFDSDSTLDTLYHEIKDLNTGRKIVNVPAERDSLLNYFNFSVYSNNRIVGNGLNQLNLREGIGLYAFINIGDVNSNGIEEIALVKKYFDFSNLNTCLIYEYYNNKWKLLFNFEIHESAFIEPVNQNEIKEYLYKKNNKWYYRDYQEYIISGIENDFKILKY